MKPTVLFLLLNLSLFAAAPSEPITKQTGLDLEITLEENHGVMALGWKGMSFVEVKSKQNKITLKRTGWGQLPNELLIIPKNQNNQAQLKKIDYTIKKLKIERNWQPLGASKIGLWGETPQAVCSLFVPLEESKAYLSLDAFPKRRSTSQYGFFYREFKKQPNLFFHISTQDGRYKSVDSNVLTEGTDLQKATCHTYYGGACDVILRVPDTAYGKLHQLKFPKIEKSNTVCPI